MGKESNTEKTEWQEALELSEDEFTEALRPYTRACGGDHASAIRSMRAAYGGNLELPKGPSVTKAESTYK